MTAMLKPDHGGDVLGFARELGCQPEECLDLSTGISPWRWPLPLASMPVHLWNRLPGATGAEEELIAAASAYYCCPQSRILPVPGSQSAIEWLPHIFRGKKNIAVPHLGYAEHAYHWSKAGAGLRFYRSAQQLRQIVTSGEVHHAVVIEPNNPSTERMGCTLLLFMADQLARSGGALIVDEAFADARPEFSLQGDAGARGLVILRSLGKFFGLPGLRLGFVLAGDEVLSTLRTKQPLWSLPAPQCWLGARALQDTQWIALQRCRLAHSSGSFKAELERHVSGLEWKTDPLFVSGFGSSNDVVRLSNRLKSAAIMSRVYQTDEKNSALIRLGLPSEVDKPRFFAALEYVESGADVCGCESG